MDILTKRPRVFEEIIGQHSIVREMKKRSLNRDFPQNMIFTGLTGTGKTTTALIVASLLNCKNPTQVDGSFQPCGKCDSCRDTITEKFSRDIAMYDASNMSKDDVIQIEKFAKMSPMYDNKRIVIIDEAQELSAKSFGVTLKLLEKHRKSTHFILCTMEDKSIGKAIKDRCQVYKFVPPAQTDIASFLFKKLKELEIEVPEEFITEGLFLISEFCEGSVRAAVGYFERCIYSEIFDVEEIKKEFGLYSEKTLTEIIHDLLDYNPKCLNTIMEMDHQEVANKIYYVLVQAKMYSLNPEIKLPDWKCRSYKKMVAQDSFDTLLEYLSKCFQLPYFRPTLFLDNLSTYLTKGKEIPIIHRRKRVQVS